MVSLCMGSSLNDEAIDYKLNCNNAKIFFFPGRSLEGEQFTYHDEVHEINALIEEVNDLRRELKNIFNDWYEVLSRPLISSELNQR